MIDGVSRRETVTSSIKEFLTEEFRLPMLQVLTDYSRFDTEQPRTRIRAFVEVLEG